MQSAECRIQNAEPEKNLHTDLFILQSAFCNLRSAFMHRPLNWGVLGAARIATSQVIPALQHGDRHRVVAIASRDAGKAAAAAQGMGIPASYGSYEELLADSDVEAIYNPLPNHLHVPWSIRAMDAGKHVLCEKPIALNASDAQSLLEARERTGKLVCEAFMVRSHPQWITVRNLVAAGRIGDVTLTTGHFSYSRRDPADVRNRVDYGGGVLYDIGCYPITMSRWLFASEPTRVMAMIDRDPEMGVDRLTSGLLEFPNGRQAAFTCGGQMVLHQTMQVYGSKGRIQLEIPFNPLHDRPSRIIVDDGRDLTGGGITVIETPAVNQFLLQADRFADAIRGHGDVPVRLEDSIANMAVIDALFRSAESGRAEAV
jgi:predicted dehydrogenase